MSLKDYIHNLQQRPVRERERIAVIATAVGFAVIFLIWIVSFKEMNKPVETQVDPTSASLNDLKNNFQTGKDSIQNMMQQLPSQMGSNATDSTNSVSVPEADNSVGNTLPAPGAVSQNPADSATNNPSANSGAPDQKSNSVPQLP